MSSQSFGRELRLLTPADFNQVFQSKPIRAGARQATLLGVPNSQGHMRIGFVIAKKSVKLAVQRNRIKRVARDFFRLQQHKLPAVDIVFIGKPGLDKLDNDALRDMLNYQRRKLCRQLKK